jgi:hypothetical protein
LSEASQKITDKITDFRSEQNKALRSEISYEIEICALTTIPQPLFLVLFIKEKNKDPISNEISTFEVGSSDSQFVVRCIPSKFTQSYFKARYLISVIYKSQHLIHNHLLALG